MISGGGEEGREGVGRGGAAVTLVFHFCWLPAEKGMCTHKCVWQEETAEAV